MGQAEPLMGDICGAEWCESYENLAYYAILSHFYEELSILALALCSIVRIFVLLV